MNLVDEKGGNLEGETRIEDNQPDRQECPNNLGRMVMVRQSGRVVKVFRPTEKIITFGRSSRCSLTLPDRRFPRLAGEIVLGPVPILTRYGKDGQKSEFVTLNPYRTFRFPPYTLTLMDRGDVYFNRPGEKGKRNLLLSIFPLLILTAMIASPNLNHPAQKENMANEINALEPTSAESAAGQGTTHADQATNQKDNDLNLKISGNDIRSLQVPLPIGENTIGEKTASTLSPIPVSQDYARNPDFGRTRETEGTTFIPAEEFDGLVNRVIYLIKTDDLESAGRVLKPLLHLFNKSQRALIVREVDPHIQALFRKAYILKPYEPERSFEILTIIDQSGLEILPSYMKVKKVLSENP